MKAQNLLPLALATIPLASAASSIALVEARNIKKPNAPIDSSKCYFWNNRSNFGMAKNFVTLKIVSTQSSHAIKGDDTQKGLCGALWYHLNSRADCQPFRHPGIQWWGGCEQFGDSWEDVDPVTRKKIVLYETRWYIETYNECSYGTPTWIVDIATDMNMSWKGGNQCKEVWYTDENIDQEKDKPDQRRILDEKRITFDNPTDLADGE